MCDPREILHWAQTFNKKLANFFAIFYNYVQYILSNILIDLVQNSVIE